MSIKQQKIIELIQELAKNALRKNKKMIMKRSDCKTLKQMLDYNEDCFYKESTDDQFTIDEVMALDPNYRDKRYFNAFTTGKERFPI